MKIYPGAWADSCSVTTSKRFLQSAWAGMKNGKLLAPAATKFDVFLTMDQNLEFQQNLASLPVAVLVIEAVSNRIEDLAPLVPEILKQLNHIQPGTLRRVRRRPGSA